MTLTKFGKFCRKLRVDYDEQLKDMAKKMGVTSSYLSSIENGKRKVPADWGEVIAEHYVLTESQLTELTQIIIIDALSEREKEALDAVVSVLYLNDSSDYINGLWGVVRVLLGEKVVENDGFELKKIADLLGSFKD